MKIFECSFESSEIRFLDFFVNNEMSYICNEGIYSLCGNSKKKVLNQSDITNCKLLNSSIVVLGTWDHIQFYDISENLIVRSFFIEHFLPHYQNVKNAKILDN